MPGRLLKLAYDLRRHRLAGWTLERWGVTLAWAAVALILAQWLVRGRPALPAWHWAVLALLVFGALVLKVFGAWAERRCFVAFAPETGWTLPAPAALDPTDKIPLRATGIFEVQNKTRLLADRTAYWRTYASREHAILAIEHRSSFLLARSPEEEAGMWYLFCRPATILSLAPGRVSHGTRTAPALRIVYRYTPPAVEGKRPPKPFDATAYLAFDDDPAREAVWRDLLADPRP